jgi:uncharacterized protein (DUF1330 family)
MPAYVVVDIEVRDPVAYEEYKRLSGDAVSRFGGRFLVRGGACETLEGSWRPKRFVILEFPSVERAREWWGSEEYLPARRIRQASAATEMVVVEGFVT